MKNMIKDLECYLNDLDNLLETGWFPNDSVEECVFYHKEMKLKEFISKGREFIRQHLINVKHQSNAKTDSSINYFVD